MKKIKILLGDPRHDTRGTHSGYVPIGIGYIGEFLRAELKDENIHMGTVLPGLVMTQLSEGMGGLIPALTAEEVAEATYDCYQDESFFVVPGITNKLTYLFDRLFPQFFSDFIKIFGPSFIPSFPVRKAQKDSKKQKRKVKPKVRPKTNTKLRAKRARA